MPIKNLTDNVIPRFPALGKLRKGSEQVNGQYGKDLNYFRFTSENKDILRAFNEAYGDQPASLHIYLPYPTVDENFSTWKEAWKAGGLLHRCDGETCTIWRTPDGKYSQQPKPCPGGCDEVGRLVMWLPELIKAGYVGYVTLETHSLHDLMNITATLQAVAQTRRDDSAGLQGIEFILRRKLEKISTPGKDGQRARRDKWLVSLEPVATWAQTYLSMASSVVAAITAPYHVDVDTGEMFDDDDVRDGEYVEHVEAKPARTAQEITDAEFEALPSASQERNGKQAPAAPAAPAAPKHNPDAPWDDARKAEAVRWAMRTYPGVYNAPKHAMNSLDNLLEECASKGMAASEIAAAWKDKVHGKYLDAQAAAEEAPQAADKPQF